MRSEQRPIDILIGDQPPEWWVKVVGMLQQNWALPIAQADEVLVLFVGDSGGVFDRLTFADHRSARLALSINGFQEYAATPDLQAFLFPPQIPLHEGHHPNGPIYSSGQYWQS